MSSTASRLTVLCILVALVPLPAVAQQRAKPAAEQQVVKVYRVIDLVLPAPNYPYEGTYLPAMKEGGSTRPSTGPVMGGMGGGMMGGMGSGMGGGMFQVPDHLAQRAGGGGAAPAVKRQPPRIRVGAAAFDLGQLIEAITTTVEPSSWDEVGGPGSVAIVGGALAIRQTPAIQAQVQEFLEALKRESGTLRTLTLQARWLLLDDGQMAELCRSGDEAASDGATIDPKVLAALTPSTQQYAGRITCFNGQTVHIISGRLHTVINGAIPVVGGSDVGYQPIMLSPHLGVLLEITPSILPEDDGVLVDLHSTITRWETPGDPAHLATSPNGKHAIDVDRTNASAQQFATSLLIPLDEPVLVGGVTAPETDKTGREVGGAQADTGGRRSGLYLVLEVRSRDDRRAAANR